MPNKFFLAGEDEVADFHESLKSFGFSVKDFELSEVVTPDTGPLLGTMTISRRSTGAKKSYAAGYGSKWPAEAHDDLRLGVFGKPSA